MVEKTRQERCIVYDLFIDQKDPGHFVFMEERQDRAFHAVGSTHQRSTAAGRDSYPDGCVSKRLTVWIRTIRATI
ncbi:putative quinol monooxygenase [Rhizobium calliandrae]|uniref:putative quinol monooxygenase n=1 Tax=Rhizobium calliandrae TaxID=1312182 RepID=UPI003D80A84E